MDLAGLHLPDAGTAGGLLDLHRLPGLAVEQGTMTHHIVHSFGGILAPERTVRRRLGPAQKVLGHFRHRPLAQGIQVKPELRHFPVVLIGREEREPNPLPDRLTHLVDPDLPLGTMPEVLGNPGLPRNGPGPPTTPAGGTDR